MSVCVFVCVSAEYVCVCVRVWVCVRRVMIGNQKHIKPISCSTSSQGDQEVVRVDSVCVCVCVCECM